MKSPRKKKICKKKVKRQSEEDRLIEYAAEEWAEFEKASEWIRSKKGNFWRMWGGETITIVPRPDDCFGWVIADTDGPRYSREVFESKEDAQSAAGYELGVGQ